MSFHRISKTINPELDPARWLTDASNRADFLPGQRFDIRLEVHAPVNGSEATGNTTPDPNFTFAIARAGSEGEDAAEFFGLDEPRLESWNFTWFEGKDFPLIENAVN